MTYSPRIPPRNSDSKETRYINHPWMMADMYVEVTEVTCVPSPEDYWYDCYVTFHVKNTNHYFKVYQRISYGSIWDRIKPYTEESERNAHSNCLISCGATVKKLRGE